MIGEFLYALTPRDQVSVGLELIHKRIILSALTPAQQCQYLVPAGRVFRMTGAWLECGPGVGQYCASTELYFRPPDEINNIPLQLPTVAQQATGNNFLAAGISDFSAYQAVNSRSVGINYGWRGELWLEAGTIVAHAATYNLAVNQNTTVLVLWGLLMPRGNLVI